VSVVQGVDHYRVLGVERDATAEDIRRAYRHLARRHHPDVNRHPGGPQRFREIARAYETLGDPAERARYDRSVARPSPDAVRAAARVARDRGPRHGILELSADEAAHLARAPLLLRDAHGGSILLPAGTAHGDHIVIARAGGAIALSVCVTQTA
jgi:curved DNA-binding protein CbpA